MAANITRTESKCENAISKRRELSAKGDADVGPQVFHKHLVSHISVFLMDFVDFRGSMLARE